MLKEYCVGSKEIPNPIKSLDYSLPVSRRSLVPAALNPFPRLLKSIYPSEFVPVQD